MEGRYAAVPGQPQPLNDEPLRRDGRGLQQDVMLWLAEDQDEHAGSIGVDAATGSSPSRPTRRSVLRWAALAIAAAALLVLGHSGAPEVASTMWRPRAPLRPAVAEEVEGKAEQHDSGSSCERCPVGHCDRGATGHGPCAWYGPPVDKGAYHCRVRDCSAMLDGLIGASNVSECWHLDGKNFYSIFEKVPCREEATPATRRTSSSTATTTARTTTAAPTTTTGKKASTSTSLRPIRDAKAKDVSWKSQDPNLTAYWDEGACGPMGEKGDDHNNKWCGGLVYVPKCKRQVIVNPSVCMSKKANLNWVSGGGDKHRNARFSKSGCNFMYFAQYECEATTTTTTSTTITTTSTISTTTTSSTTTTITTTVTSTTSSTSTTSTTRTSSTTSTTTQPEGACPQPLLGPHFDVSNCSGVRPPHGTCTVKCANGWKGKESGAFHCKYHYSHRGRHHTFVGHPPECFSTTDTSTTSTTTTTQTMWTTTLRLSRDILENQSKLENRIGRWGRWTAEAGFPYDCEDGFKTGKAPALATDYNGIRLPNVCFKKKGPHKVFVIGDWGGVLGPHGPAPANQRAEADFLKGVDDRAQQRVAGQMQNRAAKHAPDMILNAGDSFYWAGLDTKCGLVPGYAITPTGQFQWVFEAIYKGKGIDGVPWLGILGNHDYGGYYFNKGWDQIIAYTWGPGGRWVMPAQYWRTKVHYPGFSVEYWFLDTNKFEAYEPNADPEHNICSNQHKYMNGDGCGEMGPKDVLDCPGWFKNLWEDQSKWLEHSLDESTATWQVIVTHFPPTWRSDYWKMLTKQYGVDLIVTGHMHHQELHYEDAGNFLYPTAWMISGGGGGITSEGRPHPIGIDDQYGFFELLLTKDYIEVTGISHGGLERSHAFVKPRPRGVDNGYHNGIGNGHRDSSRDGHRGEDFAEVSLK